MSRITKIKQVLDYNKMSNRDKFDYLRILYYDSDSVKQKELIIDEIQGVYTKMKQEGLQ